MYSSGCAGCGGTTGGAAPAPELSRLTGAAALSFATSDLAIEEAPTSAPAAPCPCSGFPWWLVAALLAARLLYVTRNTP
jgi:hypothetical protein